MEIEIKQFSKIVEDSTRKFRKIPKGEYLKEGLFPIIDQSNEFIAGYTNDESFINFENLPVVIFGDHTRVLKYIDFPIALSADGAKALTLKDDEHNASYLYYALKNLDLPNAGYSRHFKFLKESKLPVPKNPNDQKRIAKVLSDCEDLIAKRKESIALLDELVKSTFLEMFGDPVNNEKGWDIKKIGGVCKVTKLAGYEYTKHIKYQDEGDIIMVKGLNVKKGTLKLDKTSYIDKEVSDYLIRSKLFKGDVVMTYIGVNIGDVAIIEENEKFHLAPNVSKITPINISVIDSHFLLYYLMNNRWLFVRGTTDTAKPALNMGKIREIQILIPPIKIQLEYKVITKAINELRKDYQSHLTELENLYARLSQDAFKGDLDLSGVVLRDGSYSDENLDLGMVAEDAIVYNKPQKLEDIFPALNYDYELAAVVLLTEQRFNCNYGKKYFHKMFSNMQFLASLSKINELQFAEKGWGMFSKGLAQSIENETYICKSKLDNGHTVYKVKSNNYRGVTNWIKDPENKFFVDEVNAMLSIYEKPLIERSMDRIELLNTVLECIKVLDTYDFQKIYAKMKTWKMEEPEFEFKADKFKEIETMYMITLVKGIKYYKIELNIL